MAGRCSATGPIVISDSTFSENSASDDGGAISNGDETDPATVNIVRSTVANNCAQDDGGARWISTAPRRS